MLTRPASTVLAVGLLLGASGAARGQSCPPNPAGGPNEIVLTSTSNGSDLDLGITGTLHDIRPPVGSELRACLTGCGTASQPQCAADGTADTPIGSAFASPLPVIAAGLPVCLLFTFSEPPTGSVDVQQGAGSLSLGLNAELHYLPVPTATCPRCSGAAVGEHGTCDSGPQKDAACVIDDVISIVGDPQPYTVSRSCPPGGTLLGTIALSPTVTTGASVLSGSRPCPGQAGDDACSGGSCSAACVGGAPRGGVEQYCCSNSTTKPCFPSGAPLGKIERDGQPSPPTPAWPDPTYPKGGSATLATTFCTPASGDAQFDGVAGFPGPGAVILPVDQQWLRYAPSTTSTTTIPGSSTTTTTTPAASCATPADCVDGDACTADRCDAGRCANPDIVGFEGALCRLGRLATGQPCGAETVSPRLLKAIGRLVKKAEASLGRAAAPATRPARVGRLLLKAGRAVQVLETRVNAAASARRNPISTSCAQSIVGTAERARLVIAGIQS
jgi:hypothetical protein